MKEVYVIQINKIKRVKKMFYQKIEKTDKNILILNQLMCQNTFFLFNC